MEKAAKDLDFMQAAKLRDDIKNYKDSWLNYALL
jgi:excinuclease UvrABC nuclease subunit